MTVVTSFSKDVTDPLKKAFEKAVPGATLEVQNRNTNAGVKFLEETKGNNQVDLFWASAPDAFEVLKGKKLLAPYKPKATGIAEKVGSYPVNDKDGFYSGFAASGYGIMWNERYVKAKKLPTPKEWQDLAQAPYYDHVSISAPSRSGTTHLTIETILQGEGWDKGWRTVKEIAGNLRQVTDRSFGVPEAVNSGQVGYGIVIDFFAFSSQGAGFPVKFVYPSVTTLVPANIGIVANAPNKAGAEAFIEFLLSPTGQEALLEPTIRRLPVRPETYAKAPAGLSQPLQGQEPAGAADLQRRAVGEAQRGRRRAVRPAHHLPARAAEGRDQDAARGRCGAGQEGQRPGPRPRQGSARPDRRDADHRRAGSLAGDARRLHRRQGEDGAPGRARAAMGGLRQGEVRRRQGQG